MILDENLVRMKLARRQKVKKSNILKADTVVSKAIEIEVCKVYKVLIIVEK